MITFKTIPSLNRINKMFKKVLILVFLSFSYVFPANAQQKSTKAPEKIVKIGGCNTPADTAKSQKLTLSQAVAWAAQLPLEVICSDTKTYLLNQYNFTIIYKNPMVIKDFGLGNETIPLLAKNAIAKLQAGDTVLLKDVSGIDAEKNEHKLTNIVFSITE